MKNFGKMSMWALLLMALLSLGGGVLAQESGWDEASATVILLEGDGIEVQGSGAAVQGSVVTLTQGGTYVARGTLSDGQIVIDAGNANVQLVLDGADLSCSTSAPIYAKQANLFTLYLAENSQNSVNDAETYVYEEGTDEPDAAVFSKDDVILTGGGSLTVQANYRNGITSKDDLILRGGQVQVTAVHDGIRGRDALFVEGGNYTVVAGNDGLKSNNAEAADQGMVTISGGSLAIVAAYDGVQAETALTVTGGALDIQAGGGYQNAATRQEEWGRGGWGANPMETVAGETDGDSFKGLKAGGDLTISGGIINVDAAEDGLHANGNASITGGALSIFAGDDGVHADGALTIQGGSVEVLTSYEGLEGATVEISGGDVRVQASDDGINAAGGSDEDDMGGGFGRDNFNQGANANLWIVISGGNVVISAQGDGLDSNGRLEISGGSTVVHGPTSGGNGALDANGEILVTGGTLIAAGSAGMAEVPGVNSSQCTLAYYYTGTMRAGTVVNLLGSDGDVVATYTAEKEFQTVQFSLPALTQGETYTIDTDGQQTQVTLTGVVTSVSSDGSQVQNRGGFGGRGGRR